MVKSKASEALASLAAKNKFFKDSTLRIEDLNRAALEAKAKEELAKRRLEAEARAKEEARKAIGKGLNGLFGKPKPAPTPTPADTARK